LKKFEKCAFLDTWVDLSAEWSAIVCMYYNLMVVTQEAGTSFPTGAVLIPPFWTHLISVQILAKHLMRMLK
jgi:hypothetical protein